MVAPPFERVSVHYHRGLRTGGPEALHQLVDALRRLGVDAALVPLSGTRDVPRSDAYRMYDAPERTAQQHSPDDASVIPETWVAGFKEPGPLFCWWLSVDNSDLFTAHRAWARRRREGSAEVRLAVAVAKERARRLAYRGAVRRARHLAQSAYARDALTRDLAVSSRPLSDYTTLPVTDRDRWGSPRVVAFNPAKGFDLHRQVRPRVTGAVEWLPLEGMSREQVADSLRRSDVYLELGHQPGKDRLPREAAASGATVVALKDGSGGYHEDMPIPDDHKIDLGGDVASRAAATLDRVLENIEEEHQRQAPYRAAIAQEREQFLDEVRAVFLDAAAEPGEVPG
jgi:hypothetical protein